MIELKTKITASGVLYIPKEIREAFSREMIIRNNHQKTILDNYNNNYDITHRNHQERERADFWRF